MSAARPSIITSVLNAAVYSTICVVAYQMYNYQRVKKTVPYSSSGSSSSPAPSRKKKNLKQVFPSKKKLIVVTGCDRGFGRMLAEVMTSPPGDLTSKKKKIPFQDSYIVLALTLTEDGAKDLLTRIITKQSTGQLFAMKCDVTKDTDVAKAAEYASRLLEHHQAILYGICNNAGIADPGDCLFFDTVDVYRKVMDVNYLGQVRVTQSMLPLMMRTSQVYGGRVINLSSVCGKVASPGNSSYNASKFAVEAWSDSLRIELVPFGIDVTTIRPGSVKTEIQGEWRKNYMKNLSSAPDIVREYYGNEAFDSYVQAQFDNAQDNFNPPSIVVDALVDLLTLRPDTKLEPHYWIGNDSRTFWKALSDLPAKVSDVIKVALSMPPQQQANGKLPPTECVSHLTIHVQDLKQSLPFYEAFGFQLVGNEVDGQQFLSQGTSDHPWNAMILLSENPSMPIRHKCYDAGESRLCLITFDMHRDMDSMSQAGYTPMGPVIDGKDEKVAAYTDRDGFVVYMIEPKGFFSFFTKLSCWWNKKQRPIIFHWTVNVMNVKAAMGVFEKLGFKTAFDIPKNKVQYDLLPAFNVDEKQSVIEDIRLCKLPSDTMFATLMEWTDPKTSLKGSEHLNAMTIAVDDVDEALSVAKKAGMYVDGPPVYKRLPLFGRVCTGAAYVESPKTCKIEFCCFTNKSPENFKVRVTPDRPKILMIGDSLTQTSFEGWGAGLADRYQRRADVLNRGLGGYNTRWGLRYAEKYGLWKEPGKVVLVTIFFGANDAAIIDQDPSKHVPVDEYQANLHKYIDLVNEHYPEAKVLLLTPPPIHIGQRLAYQKRRYGDKATGIPERTSDHTSKYVDACTEVGKERTVPYVDIFHGMIQAGGGDQGFGKFLSDGLHFGPLGHDFVLQAVLNAIKTNFPNLAVEPCPATGQPSNSGSSCQALPSSGPYHDEIKYKEWEKSFE